MPERPAFAAMDGALQDAGQRYVLCVGRRCDALPSPRYEEHRTEYVAHRQQHPGAEKQKAADFAAAFCLERWGVDQTAIALATSAA